jgi:hypothetical protein
MECPHCRRAESTSLVECFRELVRKRMLGIWLAYKFGEPIELEAPCWIIGDDEEKRYVDAAVASAHDAARDLRRRIQTLRPDAKI